METQQRHWLDRYSNNQHAWQKHEETVGCFFKRPIGLVESAFDSDGVFYAGRADLHCTLTLEVQGNVTEQQLQLQERVVKAWTILRLHHPLLRSTVHGDSYSDQQRWFSVQVPVDPKEAIKHGADSVTFLQHYKQIDDEHLRRHANNTARIIKPTHSLSSLFILPIKPLPSGNFTMQLLWISAHMITDGLTMYNWTSHFIDILNQTDLQLEQNFILTIRAAGDGNHLPPAQEDLYPKISGSRAKQRWFWAIMRMLRHVRKPLPAGFVNPLRRGERSSIQLERKYTDILDYSEERKPPLSSGFSHPSLSSVASGRLKRLCQESNTSIGAGCFALVALVMMELEEQKNPEVPLRNRPPFVGSFPINPRPFFNYKEHESCMLAFSDGIILPFLPSNTNIEGRFRLLARAAHRQLRSYQKKVRDPKEGLDSHSAIRVIANNYLSALERTQDKIPEKYRQKGYDAQGEYPANSIFGTATCGVSSVGPIKHWVTPGKYPVDGKSKKDFAADFRSVCMGVRARDNEFLVGSLGDSDGNIQFAVSYDASAMDDELVKRWEEKIETIFEDEDVARL